MYQCCVGFDASNSHQLRHQRSSGRQGQQGGRHTADAAGRRGSGRGSGHDRVAGRRRRRQRASLSYAPEHRCGSQQQLQHMSACRCSAWCHRYLVHLSQPAMNEAWPGDVPWGVTFSSSPSWNTACFAAAGADSWEGLSSVGAGSERGSDGQTLASGRRGMLAALRIENLGVIGEKGTKVQTR